MTTARLQFQNALAHYLGDGVLTAEEEADLRARQHHLGLTDADIVAEIAQITRARYLSEASAGNVHPVSLPGVLLDRGEVAFGAWSSMLVGVVTTKSYVKGSRGTSVRLGRVTLRSGSSRGQWVHQQHIARTPGNLVVTSKALRFYGATPAKVSLRSVSYVGVGEGLVDLMMGDDRFGFVVPDPQYVACLIYGVHYRMNA